MADSSCECQAGNTAGQCAHVQQETGSTAHADTNPATCIESDLVDTAGGSAGAVTAPVEIPTDRASGASGAGQGAGAGAGGAVADPATGTGAGPDTCGGHGITNGVSPTVVLQGERFECAPRPTAASASVGARLIFSGTGTSSGIPVVSCLLKEPVQCVACSNAKSVRGSRDKRGNTGALIQFHSVARGGPVTVAIDVGKHFWNSAIELFTAHKELRTIDAIILTHNHFDAIGGLDDLRDFTSSRGSPITVYCSRRTLEVVRRMFPYLVNTKAATGSGFVPDLKFCVFEAGVPFSVCGLQVHPFEVWHGPTYKCMAFRFGSCAWLSDVSKIPNDARPVLAECETVVLDALWSKPECHISHFGIEQAIHEVETGFGVGERPKATWLIGMNHTLPHEATNQSLRERGLPHIQLAHDSQRIDIQVAVDVAPSAAAKAGATDTSAPSTADAQ